MRYELPTASTLPIFFGFLLPHSFAILGVVFIYMLSLNDHDPSGAVTRVHKEPLNKLKYGKVTGEATEPKSLVLYYKITKRETRERNTYTHS